MMRVRRRSAAVLAFLACLPATRAARADDAAPVLDPARVGWSAIELSASKFFISASSRIVIRELDRQTIEGTLLTPPKGQPVAPGPRVIEMTYAATLAGQRTAMTLLLDPPTAAALQLVLRDSGRRDRQRSWRFTDIGGYQWTRRPANEQQRPQPPAEWTDTSEGLRPYPGQAVGRVIADPTGLIYALAAAPLRAAGDRFEILELSRRQVHRVTAEVIGTLKVSADYRERSGDGEVRRKQDISALRIKLRGTALGTPEGDDEKFALLGLTDGIEVALEPTTRLPLQLSGTAPYLGRVIMRLQSATLR